jgi:hypothetical protein
MLFCFKPPKPIAPALVVPPDDTTFYKHHGENPAQYESFRTRVAWLNEMLKFFPAFEQNGVAGSGDLPDPQPGLMVGQTPYEGPLSEDEIGYWGSGVAGRGFTYRSRIDGDNEYRYGDYHRLAQYYGGEAGAQYWGYGEGVHGHEDNNYNPASYETYEGLENLLVDVGGLSQLSEYETYLFEENNDGDVNNDIHLAEITQNEWISVREYLQGFGDKSFYQIALTGADTIDFINTNDDNWYDGYIPNNDIGYLYNSGGPQEAVYMMMALLESRRKIFYASADIFAPHWYIKDVNKNGDIMAWFDNSMDVQFGDVDENNKGALLKYFQLQHSLHSVLPAFSTNDAGMESWMYSARDRVAFKEFRTWIHREVQNHIDDLAAGAEKTRIQSLFSEFKFDIVQPYGRDGRHDNQQSYVGWDFLVPGQDPNNDRYGQVADEPDYANPLNLFVNDEWHWNFATSQIYGMNENQIKGRVPLEYNGNYYNLYDSNWMVHTVGRLLRSQEVSTKRMVEAQSINAYNKTTYRRQKRAYKKAVEAEKEAKYEEAQSMKAYLKRRAENKRNLNKASKKKPKAKVKKTEKSYADALKESHINMMNKSVSRSVQKMRELRKASQARNQERNRPRKSR